MKKIVLLVSAVFASMAVVGQNNEVSLESYRAFQFGTPQSFGSFDSEFITLSDGSDMSGVKFSAGLNYTRHFKNDFFVRFRPGVSLDSRKDDSYQLYTQEFGYEKYELDGQVELKRSSVNLFVGGGKQYELSNRFSIAVGLDLGFISEFDNSFSQKVRLDIDFDQNGNSASEDFLYTRDYARYNRIGLMPIISPKFKLNDAFSISMELQFLALYSFTNGEERYTYQDTYTEYNQGYTTTYKTDTDITFNSKASIFSISKMSPLLRFSYRF
jgi:hypothetical protein